MIGRGKLVLALLVVLGFSGWMSGQQGTPQSPASVPRLVNFSGRAIDETTKSVSGIAAITFSIYKDQYGGSSLWMETQNVRTDAKGNYTVQLGATTSEGLPLDLFASGEGRWLGTRVNGGEEQPRVLLLSVPYALKAADAQTLGGLPASAFALAGTAGTGSSGQLGATTVSGSSPAGPNVGGSGTQDYIPIWTDGSGDLGNSILYQTGSGSSAKVGINETKPLFTLDVNGQELVRGLFEMATTNYANKSKGFSSNPINLESSAFNSSTQKYTLNHFQWQAEPSGNNTATPGATLNLLYGTDPASPSETGLSVSSAGVFTFAPTQTFPGTGTITGITAGTDLTGGGSNGTVTLNVDTTKVPELNAANTFTGNQTVNGNLSATGVVNGSSYEIGSNAFAFGSYTSQNAFLGFAGNGSTTGSFNTGTGWQALLNVTSGQFNMASGTEALQFNTTGSGNTAVGSQALQGNNAGAFNTAGGAYALLENTTGSNNTATGYKTLYGNKTGTDNTSDGYQALYYNLASGITAVGSQALTNNTTGAGNTSIGYQTLQANNTGFYNTAVGYQSLYSNTFAGGNTAAGYQALYSNVASDNTAMGYKALYSDTSGGNNIAIGTTALYKNIGGSGNTAVGGSALSSNFWSNGNTAIGAAAFSGGMGPNNTAVGGSAVANNQDGQGNTGVGVEALYSSTSGDYLTCIGYQCTVDSDGLSNATALGAFASVGENNALVLGGTGDHAVKVGIGTTTPSNILTIARGAGHPVSDSWETYSSRRWKTNIRTLPDALSKVEHLRGVSYDLKDSGRHEIGVIAEEVGAVVPEVVSYEANGKDASGVDYSRLTALLIEAIKQQQKEFISQGAAQHRELRKLRRENVLLENRLTQLQKQVRELKQVKSQVADRSDNHQTSVAKAQF